MYQTGHEPEAAVSRVNIIRIERTASLVGKKCYKIPCKKER